MTGCVSLEQLSSGHVGCSPAEVAISEERKSISGHTWTAECQAQKFYCSTHGGGENTAPSVACTPGGSATPGGTSAAPAIPETEPEPTSVGGCTFDTQCKGDRICEDGTCVTPSVTAPTEAEPEPSEPDPAPAETVEPTSPS